MATAREIKQAAIGEKGWLTSLSLESLLVGLFTEEQEMKAPSDTVYVKVRRKGGESGRGWLDGQLQAFLCLVCVLSRLASKGLILLVLLDLLLGFDSL
jgi:hypothetical protein